MKQLFLIPFTTGIFHGMAREQKLNPQWGVTNSILGTVTVLTSLIPIKTDNPLKSYSFLQGGGIGLYGMKLVASCVFTGTNFCLGHLLTKKAYPVLKTDFD